MAFVSLKPRDMKRDPKLTNNVPTVATEISAIAGLLLFIMAFAYLFLAVSVNNAEFKNERSCSCRGLNSTQIFKCKINATSLDGIAGDQIGPGNKATANGPVKDSQSFKEKNAKFCRNVQIQTVAGSAGIVCGFIQMVAASFFLIAGVTRKLRFIWLGVHVPVIVASAAAGACVFWVYIYKRLNPRPFDALDGEEILGPFFYHEGHTSAPGRGNAVVLAYGSIAGLDACVVVAMTVIFLLSFRTIK